MSLSYSVYCIRDSRDTVLLQSGQRAYIGFSQTPYDRFVSHLKEVISGGCTYKCRWIRSLFQEENVEPILSILCVLQSVDEAKRVESAWILRLRARGVDLTNATNGGDGLINPTAETRLKMSASHLGKKMPIEVRQKIQKANTGKPSHLKGKPNPHHSAMMMGKPAWNKGKVGVSEETRQKMSRSRIFGKSK